MLSRLRYDHRPVACEAVDDLAGLHERPRLVPDGPGSLVFVRADDDPFPDAKLLAELGQELGCHPRRQLLIHEASLGHAHALARTPPEARSRSCIGYGMIAPLGMREASGQTAILADVRQARSRDDGSRLYEWAQPEVLVVCPRCSKRAVVHGQFPGAGRLTCPHCGVARDSERTSTWGGPVDPWLSLPLWIQTRLADQTLWAFNARHLSLLSEYVSAEHRERSTMPACPGGEYRVSRMSMIEKLPRWMKSRKSRDRLRRALHALEARASSDT